ncbi:DUF2059 domain-containing protein [Pontibacter pudoricolor]|uniref:hypothetical protein n=1 Tax=Pontibacter pudoricolor TaxID=2694930 RepID=UPI0013913FA6|nr:hypothetical protein [Pontibacter pudoricolor]
MRICLIVTFCSLFFAFNANSQSLSYKSKVHKIYSLIITEEARQVMIDKAIDNYSWVKNKESYAFWNEFTYEMRKIDVSDFAEIIIPVYYKYLSEEDLETFIESLTLPQNRLGIKHQMLLQKMSANASTLNEEAYNAGSIWGQQKADGIIRKLRSKGI